MNLVDTLFEKDYDGSPRIPEEVHPVTVEVEFESMLDWFKTLIQAYPDMLIWGGTNQDGFTCHNEYFVVNEDEQRLSLKGFSTLKAFRTPSNYHRNAVLKLNTEQLERNLVGLLSETRFKEELFDRGEDVKTCILTVYDDSLYLFGEDKGVELCECGCELGGNESNGLSKYFKSDGKTELVLQNEKVVEANRNLRQLVFTKKTFELLRDDTEHVFYDSEKEFGVLKKAETKTLSKCQHRFLLSDTALNFSLRLAENNLGSVSTMVFIEPNNQVDREKTMFELSRNTTYTSHLFKFKDVRKE